LLWDQSAIAAAPPDFVGKKVKAILVFPEIIKGVSWSA